ncbi:MAG: TrmH family RNA methyltransferase [Acidimicrobiales bacterium]
MVEGPLAIRHLLASPFPVRSLLVTDRGWQDLAPDLAGVDAPAYLVTQPQMERICGFDFHRGALASADRLPPADPLAVAAQADVLLVVEGVNDYENLGALFRNAAAFGAGAVVLDPTTCDPLYRRVIRVSVGHALRVPFARVEPVNWPSTLGRLREKAGYEVIALTPSAEAEDVRGVAPGGRRALLVGAEGHGLSPAALAAADRRARIAMAPGVDSLNVATAAAVALHHLVR